MTGSGGPGRPTIGVVIPTCGRPSLARAVASVLGQTLAPDAVAVVVDGPADLLAAVPLPPDARIRVWPVVPARGPAHARNAGAEMVGTDLVAFLDDDDEWAPEKLRVQLDHFQEMRSAGVRHPVVACRSIVQDEEGREITRVPRHLIQPNQRVGDYLFRRRQLRPGGSALGASMVLCEVDLVRRTPFDPSLPRHEDWDWILRVGELVGVRVAHADAMLLRYTRQPCSRSGTARASAGLAFLAAHSGDLTPCEKADYLLCVAGHSAVVQRDWVGLRTVVATALRLRAGSVWAWLALAAELVLATQRRVTGWVRGRWRTATGRGVGSSAPGGAKERAPRRYDSDRSAPAGGDVGRFPRPR